MCNVVTGREIHLTRRPHPQRNPAADGNVAVSIPIERWERLSQALQPIDGIFV